MKTPREVLLAQHQAAEPKLDAIRKEVLAEVKQTFHAGRDASPRRPLPATHGRLGEASLPGRVVVAGWRQFWWSLHWHLAGLSAVWLVVLALSIDQSPAPTREVAQRPVLSSQQLLAALRENQRQLRELVRVPAAEEAPEPPHPAPSPRSQIQPFSMASA